LRKEIEKGSIHPPLLNLGQTLILTTVNKVQSLAPPSSKMISM